jgi:hypothetical protein
MRLSPAVLCARVRNAVGCALAATLLAGCGLEQLAKTDAGASEATADAGAEAAAVDSGVAGAACGVESGSGAQLCRATSLCPSVVVDSQALPHCGFRIKGGAAELLCGCGDAICSMGAYATCAQAASLLASQTEAQVCTQLAEGRCSAGTPAPSTTGQSNPACDRACLQECGGGGGCASLCGC